ncbi:MAG: PIN domain protein [Bacteroidetes bacterium 4484_276]|nr:MAG: PIN domain protein [Bacteroidetes bacterium 4484_276]OYT12793.1 MAG: PIN domain protein [Bacteroidetes bacterium 4572_114]
MKTLKLYIDTSVIGGYFDPEFEFETKKLFESVRNQEYDLVLSDVTQRELLGAPQHVKTLLNDIGLTFETVETTTEVYALAEDYLNEKVVGRTSTDDCLHIALATVYKIDILVSWNFKHIVNIKRIFGYNSINLRNGYPRLEIRSPKNLIDYEE